MTIYNGVIPFPPKGDMMKPFPRLIPIVALTLALAGAVGAARAAEDAAQSHHSSYRFEHSCEDMDARMAAHLAYAEVKLALSEPQRAEFKRVAETMKAAHDPMRKLCAEAKTAGDTTTLPARLERMQKFAEAHAEALRKTVPALTQFYKSLTPDQQKIADRVLSQHGGGHGGGHGDMQRHHGN